MDIKHILIPYTGTDSEQELLRTTFKMARCMRARVHVIYVVEVPMALPVDVESLPGLDEANALLDHAEDIARTTGIKISTSLLQARDAGHAIIEEAAERKVDLILMEARQRIKLGMLELGETVDYVMKHAKCAVWVSRLYSDYG